MDTEGFERVESTLEESDHEHEEVWDKGRVRWRKIVMLGYKGLSREYKFEVSLKGQ